MARSRETPALHGRLPELELLELRLEEAGRGTLRTVLLEGEAGIGKTRLLETTLRRASDRFHVFAGGADELERARPFGPLVEALGCRVDADHPLRAEIARLIAGDRDRERTPLEPTRDAGLQFRVVDAFVELAEELALGRPVVLALEDMQWADPSTVLTIRSLSRRLRYVPVAMLLTMRPLPRSDDLERLVDALIRDGGHRLVLGPLGDEAVHELVAQMVQAEPGAALREQVAGAAGNPLFVTELVKTLGDEGAIDVVDGQAELREVSLAPSLRLTILRRLSFLDEATLELLRMASVLGSTFSLRDVATILARSPADLLRPVRDAIRAGVLEERDARLGFRHDLIREAIYEDVPADARAALHLEAGRRLAAAGAPALRVAEQLALGAEPGDAEAAAWLHDAAHEAARQAPAIAVDLLERALELLDDTDDRRLRVLADLVPTSLWAGRPRQAEARAREALTEALPPELEGRLRVGLVQALLALDRPEEVVQEAAIAMEHTALPADLRSQLQAEAANGLSFSGDLAGAERAAQQAIAVGTPVRSEGVETGLLILSDAAGTRGNFSDALTLAQEALEHARLRRGERTRVRPEIFLAMALRNLDRFEEAHEAIQEGRRADERLGHASFLPIYHYEAASLLFNACQWDDAVAQAQTGLALAEEVGLDLLRQWASGVLAAVAVHRDELDAAAGWVADGGTAPLVILARALLEEARGDGARALARLQDDWDLDASRGVRVGWRITGPELVRLAVVAGDRARAAAVASDLEEWATVVPVPSLEGAALRCRGLAGDDVDLLLRAVDAYGKGPRAFERAAACEDAAAGLARAGRIDEATRFFDQALDVYERVGAHRDVARALSLMRELGIGRKRRGARKRPAHGWESLTPSEVEVVRLAAEGLTNPEIGRRLFISPRTVQTHLAHSFRKLDISSRVELAAEAARRQTV